MTDVVDKFRDQLLGLEELPGSESITSQFEYLKTELNAIRLPLMERSSIKNGIQFVRSLQDENGGFFLSMESTQTSPLMTGYGIWTYGTCGLGKNNKDVVRALNFLKECQGSDGGFPFYLGSSQALTPTAIVANAMIELGFEQSEPMLRKATNYILAKLNNGSWTQSSESLEMQTIDPILTQLCVRAVGDQLTEGQKATILSSILDAYRTDTRGWGAPGSTNTDVDNTVMVLQLLNDLENVDSKLEKDRLNRIKSAEDYIKTARVEEIGGWSTRYGDGVPSIDTTGLVLSIYGAKKSWLDTPLRNATNFLFREQLSDGSWADDETGKGDLDSTFFALHGLTAACGDLVPHGEILKHLEQIETNINENYQNQIDKANAIFKAKVIKKMKIIGGAIAAIAPVGLGVAAKMGFL